MGFRERKLEKERIKKEKLELEQKEKEIQAKINIKRTLLRMKNQSQKLEKLKQQYIENAKKAAQVGDQQAYKLAKSGLKICLSKQRVIETMIANFEISMQLNDINNIIRDFVDGINIMSDQMKNITSNIDMVKAQTAYEKAMANNQGQYEALDAFLEAASETISSFDGVDSNVSDHEIDELISNSISDSESDIDKEIDEKIGDIQSQLEN